MYIMPHILTFHNLSYYIPWYPHVETTFPIHFPYTNGRSPSSGSRLPNGSWICSFWAAKSHAGITWSEMKATEVLRGWPNVAIAYSRHIDLYLVNGIIMGYSIHLYNGVIYHNSGYSTYNIYRFLSGWWFFATPLKHDGLRQLGWHSQYMDK